MVCWRPNLILLACNLTLFWKKWIRSTPHIWSQIPLFRVTLTYVNYLSFFDFFTCFFVWMQNILMIVIVLRCHTGLTFYFMRFCFIFAKDVKYFEKWKWKVSKYLSWFFNFWSRLRIPRDMETLGVLILLTLVPHLYQKKKNKTGLGNNSKLLFVLYN